MAELFFIYNNKFYPANTPVISSANRSLRYGDGLFETIKIVNDKIINVDFHFERLFAGLSILHFDIPASFKATFFEDGIKKLLKKNNHLRKARVRITVFRGNGGIFDPENLQPDFIIESWELPFEEKLNENGLIMDLFPDARKSCDIFSNLKSNNYLPYVMAALFAKKQKINDCILLNSCERICDSVIANIFIIKDEKIFTPPLSEGCVAGVMRRWMIEKFDLKPYQVIEQKLTVNDILSADEFFLTNAISHVRWVKNFKDKNFANEKVKEIYHYISNHLI
jgi:branched-chain amino acid aminotransferase